MNRVLLGLLWISVAAAVPGMAEAAPQLPGPDAALFNHPYYSCKTSYYVATGGSDGQDGTSPATAWASLQHANDAVAAGGAASGAGTCIIVEPGTYMAGVQITAGGNAAASTGYLVYRCAKLDACTVTGPTGGGAQAGQFAWTQPNGPGSYVFVDGFVLAASDPGGGIYGKGQYGQGIQLWDGNDTVAGAPFSVHHIWLINNIIHGYGQAGININDGEYFFAVHNTLYGNANAGCSAQGSGIAFVELKAIPGGYTRTPDDADNKILGHVGNFNNAISWNVTYNNATTQCGTAGDPYDSDGNDIILDTLNNGNIGAPVVTGPIYPGSVLVDFNIAYNAGGRGIHIFRSENITVANNSCYNSDLDPYDTAAYRPCIGDNVGYNNVFFNNLAYAIPQPDEGVADCGGSGQGCLGFNGAYAGGLAAGGGVPDRFFNNFAYCTSLAQPFGYGCTPMFSNNAMRTSAAFYAALSTGGGVTLSGALPGPLVQGTVYYAVKVGDDQVQFAATAADATANPPVILGFYNLAGGRITITDLAHPKPASFAIVQTDSFPTGGTKPNFAQSDPGWMDVGAESAGNETTPPVGANFALKPGSAAIGHGVVAGYLGPQSKDAGACPGTVSRCPAGF